MCRAIIGSPVQVQVHQTQEVEGKIRVLKSRAQSDRNRVATPTRKTVD